MAILAAFAVPHPPLLIPGVGDDSKADVVKTRAAYEEVARRAAALQPETLVFFSPHAPLYYDYFHISPGAGARGDFANFGARRAAYSVVYDEEFVAVLVALLAKAGIPGGTLGERDPALDHGVMVPLHFFGGAAGAGAGGATGAGNAGAASAAGAGAGAGAGAAGAGVKVVRVGLSGLSFETHREFGRLVAEAASILERRTVIVASGDLSHKLLASGPYGYVPEGPELDGQICAALADGAVLRLMAIDEQLADTGAECGLRSFIMMAGALEGHPVAAELLSYEGPFGVGYAVASYLVDAETASDAQASGEVEPTAQPAAEPAAQPAAQPAAAQPTAEPETSLPVGLARQTLEAFFALGNKRPQLKTAPIQEFLEQCQQDTKLAAEYAELAQRQAGVFVSLHEGEDLRGCIGTIGPTRESILAEIVQNAVSAAREDPRFFPVTADELAGLTINVDVLGEAEVVFDRTTLDAQRYGVIVTLGRRRGLLLPALEGVDTPAEQIAIALSKAGIGADEPYELERFEVVRYT